MYRRIIGIPIETNCAPSLLISLYTVMNLIFKLNLNFLLNFITAMKPLYIVKPVLGGHLWDEEIVVLLDR